ncbi:MAG: helix-turn-helix domain-containing protein [Spirochaetales bacterium]|nr:helix-turn-helix domain-containing protein [Spirochaetales bacterium]
MRKILSANIKIRRKILGISQEKLAETSCLSAQTINDIEGCRMWVSDKTIVKLAEALHVEAYQLFIPVAGPQTKSLTTAPHTILLDLQQNIKKDIDKQFEKILKTDASG